MTSLSQQLNRLRTGVTAQLGVERSSVSLLFDKREISRCYKEDILKIGQVGLIHLRKVDPEVAHTSTDSEDLFAESSLHFQRVLLSKDENAVLDSKLKRLIIDLSPYLLHSAAQQILEWLIFRYQIHTFNSELMFITFLPFHETNIFGRLLSILELKGIEYDWVQSYKANSSPIPFNRLVTICFSANHSLLSLLSNHIKHIQELYDGDVIERKTPYLFTLFTSLCIHALSDSSTINDGIISKFMSFLPSGLRSNFISLRLSCLMVTSQLCVAVKLTPDRAKALLKLILLKIKANTMEESMNASVVICQRQNIDCLPMKIINKLARKDSMMGLTKHIICLSLTTNLLKFLATIWRSVIPHFVEKGDCDDDHSSVLCAFFNECISEQTLNAQTVSTYFSFLMEICGNNQSIILPQPILAHTRALILRYAQSFDVVREEWHVRDLNSCRIFIQLFNLQPHEIGCLPSTTHTAETKRKRCKRASDSSMDVLRNAGKPDMKMKKENLRRDQVCALIGETQVEFDGNPMVRLLDLIQSEQWDLAKSALSKLVSLSYQKHYDESDFRDIVISLVRIASNVGTPIKANIAKALSQLPMSDGFALELLKRSDDVKPLKKRGRSVGKHSVFDDEDERMYSNRQIFVLEVLYANDRLKASSKLLLYMFDFVKDVLLKENGEESSEFFMQQLAISFLIRLLKFPQEYSIRNEDLYLDGIVETIRSTNNHRILRDCLRLLTAAVHISPSGVLSQIMSVFTFMGGGLLKSDNDLTLSIIEESLSVVLSVVNDEQDRIVHERLLTLSRIFITSIVDIPAHRRVCILHALSKAADHSNSWAIVAALFEKYCCNWHRSTDLIKSRDTIELFEEMATEVVSKLSFDQQLFSTIDLIEYIIHLGSEWNEAFPAASFTIRVDIREFPTIFDRSKYSVQKMRHFRFTIIGWIARHLSSCELFDKITDTRLEDVEENLLAIGKKVLFTSMQLDEFVKMNLDEAQRRENKLRNSAPVNAEDGKHPVCADCRYWTALATRSAIITEKMRTLLPASVCAKIIDEILSESEANAEIRDRALQLLNTKLTQDGRFSDQIKTVYLDKFVSKLNKWIICTQKKEEVVLCQNVAFTLKLIIRNLRVRRTEKSFSETLSRSSEILANWTLLDESMIGNILLLVGELVRSHSASSVIVKLDIFVTVCIDFIKKHLDRAGVEDSAHVHQQNVDTRSKRIRQSSLCGRRIGGHLLFTCALTCLQRIMEEYSQFITQNLFKIFNIYGLLVARYGSSSSSADQCSESPLHHNKQSSVCYRLEQIKKSFVQMEMRLILEPIHATILNFLHLPEALISVLSLISTSFETKTNKEWTSYLTVVFDIFLASFTLRSSNLDLKISEIDDFEVKITDHVLRVFDRLSENQIHPFMKRLCKWIEPLVNTEKPYGIITTIKFLNRFYESYNTLSLPYLGRFFAILPIILIRSNCNTTECQTRLFNGNKRSVERLSADALVKYVIDLITNCAKHQHFFTVDRALSLTEPLVNEIDNEKVDGHEERCLRLADCFLNIAELHNDLLSEMMNKIMLKTRSYSAKVRYRALLLLEKMFERMGVSVAPLLPLILPTLSEISEDENTKVEGQCGKVIMLLRQKFGEDIADGFA